MCYDTLTWIISGVIILLMVYGVFRTVKGWTFNSASARLDGLASAMELHMGTELQDENIELVRKPILRWFERFEIFDQRLWHARQLIGVGLVEVKVGTKGKIENVEFRPDAAQSLRQTAMHFRDCRANELLWATLSFALAGSVVGLFAILAGGNS